MLHKLGSSCIKENKTSFFKLNVFQVLENPILYLVFTKKSEFCPQDNLELSPSCQITSLYCSGKYITILSTCTVQ